MIKLCTSNSWRSNLLFLSLLFTSLVLSGIGVTAAEVNPNGDDSPTKPGSLFDTVKHIYKVAVNGPDPNLLYERDSKDGIIRLTDENYAEMVEDPLRSGSGDEVWVVLVHGKPGDALSETLLEYHKQSSDLVKSDKELQKVKFARIDYMTSWKTCTRWLLTKPPYLVFITSSGKQLRFVPTQSIGTDPENLHKVIRDKMYEVILPWDSKWAPRGDRSYLIEHYISLQEKFSNITSGVPNWILLLFTGILTQQLMSWLHGSSSPSSNSTTGSRSVVREEKVVRKED